MHYLKTIFHISILISLSPWYRHAVFWDRTFQVEKTIVLFPEPFSSQFLPCPLRQSHTFQDHFWHPWKVSLVKSAINKIKCKTYKKSQKIIIKILLLLVLNFCYLSPCRLFSVRFAEFSIIIQNNGQ